MTTGARSPDRLIWLISASLAAAGTALWWRGFALPQLTPAPPWPLLAACFLLTERVVVHIPFGRDVHSLTFNQVPLVLALTFLSPDELLLAGISGVLVGNTVVNRRPPIKVAFNVSSTVLQLAAAGVVFSSLLAVWDAEVAQVDAATWLAALAAAGVADALASMSLYLVISLRQRRWDRSALIGVSVSAVLGTLIGTDLALVVVVAAVHAPAALLLLALAVAMCFLLYRGYLTQRQRFGQLELLYRFTDQVDQALLEGRVEEAVRAEARELLRAREARILWLHDNAAEGAPEREAPWWRAAQAGELVRVGRGDAGPVADLLRGEGHSDGMAAPLREGGQVVGVLAVLDRLDDVSTFDRDDGRLLEALAGSASVALANSRLLDRIRDAAAQAEHLSLHDPLTGLPNRLSFHASVDHALAETGPATVLLMDVDRFKEVNDTLGHDVGDLLLTELADRLRRLAGRDVVVARLGGDEFAVLLRGNDEVYVEAVLARITRDVTREVTAGGVSLDVSASIGIAISPADGTSATTLLRRAEVAMYDSKTRRSGVARYSADRDPYNSRRLTLIGDLARALENRALDVHYQPMADPQNGRINGVEALLRWNHPVWGNVPPDEFVALAEHTGLIRPLTRYVLGVAVEQCVQWRQAGTPVVMSVNISARNLVEPELTGDVARLLVQAGLPAGLLKIEVTESALMAEPERSLPALQSLVELGVMVSVDDFGTGYSSLGRLRDLPVHEVKIDRSFVRGINESQDDLAIVRAVIGLGHDLGLQVVAEGVEDDATWRLLHGLDCDLVQGYFLARPMPGAEMTAWLRGRFAGFATPLTGERDAATVPRRAEDPRSDPAVGS